MEKKRLLAAVMAVIMVISLLPSMVFASAPAGELGGKLKIKGLAAVGVTLSADYSKAKPEGLTDDNVTFQWTRKITDTETADLGTDKTYTLTEEDLGYEIILKVTAKEEFGLTGSLKAKTLKVAASEEEAKLLAEQNAEETESQNEEIVVLENEEPSEELNLETPELQNAEEQTQETPEVQPSEEQIQETPEIQEIPEAQDTEEKQPEESGEFQIYNEEEFVLNEEGQQPEKIPEAENGAAAEEAPQDPVQKTEDSGAEAIPAAKAVVDTENGVLDFGKIEAGSESEAQYVEIQNVGTETLNFPEISPEHFMVKDIYEPLESGDAVSVWVMPRAGLEPGTYEDTIVYTTEEGADASFKASVIVEEQEVQPAETEGEAADNAPAEVPADNSANEQKTDNTAAEGPAAVSVTAEPSALEPYTLKEGYEQAEPRTVILTNTGDTALTIQQPKSESGFFVIGEISASTLAAGEKAQFTVQPVGGLTAGTYDEPIQIMGAAEGNEMQVLTTVSANAVVEKKEVYAISVSPSVLDFGSSEKGYAEAPQPQKVTVTNKGTETITIGTPESISFVVGNFSQEVIAPGESCTFDVQPKTGLEDSLYLETILIPNDAETAAQVDVQFEVTAPAVNLTGIQAPAEISGIKNGAEKSADGLKLPSSVTIKTTAGKMKAKVKWDVSGCEYNPSSKEAQTFKVKGTVTLPDGVGNPDEVGLITSVKVSVNAGYTPKKADPTDNMITGISSTGYTTQSKITFTAVGAGMENTSPRKGDERYVPFSWTVINTNSWQAAPYSATFGITKSGTYTLTVNFVHQSYDGSAWTETGLKDAKQVNFSIAEAQVVTPTSTPIPGAANQRNAVQTGDDTNIMIFVIILAIAVGSIAGVLVYKKKHK